MIKTLKYFLEALVVYSFFLVIKIIGLSLSRKFFALIFRCFGSVIKPNKIIDKNLKYFDKEISDLKKKEIISGMWSNYGMTFVEYIFFKESEKK